MSFNLLLLKAITLKTESVLLSSPPIKRRIKDRCIKLVPKDPLSTGRELVEKMDAFQNQLPPMASLANMTSGMTFAAKARAAELNAVRAQKAAQVIKSRYEEPAPAPVFPGSVKFTMPRNRGPKAWKPLKLSELPDQGLEDDIQSALHSSPAVSTAVSATSSQNHNHVRNQQLMENKRALVAEHSTTHTASPFDQHSLYQYSPLGGEQSTSSDHKGFNYHSSGLYPSMAAPNMSYEPSNTYQVQGLSARSGNQLQASSNRSGYQYSVRPSTDPVNALASKMSDQMNLVENQDPFMEQPKTKQPSPTHTLSSNPVNIHQSFGPQKQAGSTPAFANNPSSIHPSIASLKQPAAVKGTMDYNFRFPQPVQPHLSPQTSSALDQPVATPKVSVPTVKPSVATPSSSTYTRDPKPYSSYSASKKEFLLQNLDRQVAESEARGDLPKATRTVLYDPLARGSMGQPQPSYPDTPAEAPEVGKETLRTSEPLPWHHRPVSIFNSPTAYTFDKLQEHEQHGPPSFPPGLCPGNEYIYSLAQQPKRVERSMEELEAWWHNDTRAQGIPRATLNELSDARYAKDPPGYRRSTDSYSTITSPISAKTGSPIAAIGAERAARSNRSTNSSAPSNDIDDMLKQVCVNMASYISDRENGTNGYFGRYARVPEWCIDKGPRGNESFFGDWGVPPSRVGRDPRYRPTFHEGRYTVFEEMDRRGGQGPTIRRYH